VFFFREKLRDILDNQRNSLLFGNFSHNEERELCIGCVDFGCLSGGSFRFPQIEFAGKIDCEIWMQ